MALRQHQRVGKSLRENARELFQAMDHATRLKIFEAMGTVDHINRGELAVQYLCEPVHLAQFQITVLGGRPSIKWAA